MALSSSESALLTQTCENMNVAANTCREVLEMLRSLGNTGVVDIATHNNAQNPHADAKNLFHLDANGAAILGNPSITATGWTMYRPLGIQLDNQNRAVFKRWSETKGSSEGTIDELFVAITDSNGDFVARSDIYSSFGNKQYIIMLDSRISFWDSEAHRKAAFQVLSGASGDNTHQAISFRFNGANASGTYVYFYTLEHNAIIPWGNQTIGTSQYPFDGAYFRTAATVTSDRRVKSGISAIGSEAVDFLKALRPVQFTVREGKRNVLESDEDGNPTNVEIIPGTRRHWGLIAQEVQEALVSAGYDPSACAVWSLADKNDPDSRQALRYEELIAPMIKVIQQQQERIEALERKVA